MREDKIKTHLDKLTAHALTMPPFRFTYEGQETVRPRPLTTLITRMVATNPRHRLPADKIDEKLSMLGGISQIYHGACCKRPISWVEDKWDRKFAALISLQKENELQRNRIDELERVGETYEARLESERHKHEQDISRLQTLLRAAEDRCQTLHIGENDRRNRSRSSRGSHGHDVPRPRQMPRRGQPHPNPASTASTTGPTKIWPQSAEVSKPNPQAPKHAPQQRHQPRPSQPAQSAAAQQVTAISTRRGSPASVQTPRGKTSPARSPSITSLPGYALRSRGSGSKLPRPITPSRSNTPVLGRDASTTDSSMTSSIFSRQSLETLPTPTGSPMLERTPASDDRTSKPRMQPTESAEPPTPSRPRPVTASPEVTDLASDKLVPSLQPMKSWADVAKIEQRRRHLV